MIYLSETPSSNDCKVCELVTLQPFDLQEQTVPHLKDLNHICLELEAQGHIMTSEVLYLQSK